MIVTSNILVYIIHNYEIFVPPLLHSLFSDVPLGQRHSDIVIYLHYDSGCIIIIIVMLKQLQRFNTVSINFTCIL